MTHANLPDGWFMTPLRAWSFIYRPRHFYDRLRERFGECATLRSPYGTVVMALTSTGAQEVLAANPDGYEAYQKEAFRGLAGSGSLFVLDGPRHRRERQLLLPAFHAQRVRSYGTAIQEITTVHTNAWQPGQCLQAGDVMLAISRDVIQRIVFGPEQGARLDEARTALTRMLAAANPLLEYLLPFQSWWSLPWLRFQRAKREFNCFVERRIAERRAAPDHAEDVLGLLLTARYDDGAELSNDAIRDELYTILLPGHATTSTALAWALYELGRHPAALARLRNELDMVGPDPAPDLIVKQPFLDAVCQETLRLHTVVTEVARLVRSPFTLLDHDIPEGVGVGISLSAIHHDPALYPEPDVFRPERFLQRTFRAAEFLPFGGGHRRCLGAALSEYEMRIVLAMIVMRWEYELTGVEKEVRHNLGMGPKHGVRLRLTARRGP